MEGVRKWGMEARVPLGMLLVQVILTGMQILSRLIFGEGAFVIAVIMYRHIVAAFCVLPFALYSERGAVKEVGWAAMFWIFMVALTGTPIAMGLFYYGMKDTTATYATNFLNLVPIVTFLFSIILRVEKPRIRTRAGKIKSLGAALCLAGALTVALYNGKPFHLTQAYCKTVFKAKQNKARGTVLLMASCLSYPVWYILQVKLYKVFPHTCWATLLICVTAATQCGVVGVVMDRKPEHWALGWNLQLVTIVYSGVLGTATNFCLLSWAIVQKGPTYAAMFSPLTLILVGIAEAVFLGEEIWEGSLIGTSLILGGMYAFLWGKSKDVKAAGAAEGEEEGKCTATVAPGEQPDEKQNCV